MKKIDTEDARQGTPRKMSRETLMISLPLVVIVMGILLYVFAT